MAAASTRMDANTQEEEGEGGCTWSFSEKKAVVALHAT